MNWRWLCLLPFGGLERLNDGVERSHHDTFEIVPRLFDAMVGQAILREVVRADFF